MKTKSKSIKRLIWFSIPLLLTFIFVAINTNLLAAKKVECFTQFGDCPDMLTSSLAWLINYPLLKPLPAEKIRFQFTKFPEIEKYQVFRRLPTTLVFGITLRKPFGLVTSSVLGAQAFVDEKGVVYSQGNSADFPVLNVPDLSKIPNQLNPDQIQALTVLSQLQGDLKETISGQLDQKTLSITLSNGIIVLVDIYQPPTNWTSSLQIILARSKIVAKMPRSIDLRFNNPIITYPGN